jgi:segregation and condensation protein A
MTNDQYTVKVENIFEGPMDLLLHLIKKHEVDIYDIPIALITQQYLAYMEWIRLMNVDNAGDFILMASTLAQIKSRTLLPIHDNDPEEEDPRLEIARPLMEYLKIKSAANQLAARNLLGEHTFVRKIEKEETPPQQEEVIHMGLFELIDAFQKILKRFSAEHRVDLSADRISIKDRIAQIVDILEEKGSATFDELFDAAPDRSGLIVTFLAILEMVKLSLVRVMQHVQSGIIRLIYL